MTPEVHDLLVRALQQLRDVKATRDPDTDLSFAHFGGILSALDSTHVLNSDEIRLWQDRSVEIHQAANPRRRRKKPAPSAPRPPIVRRVIAGPPTPKPFLDGWIRVVAIEIFDSLVRVHWNLGPLPGYQAILGDDLDQLDRDTVGLPEEEREHQRQSARWTRLFSLQEFSLSDDVGTRYRYTRGRSGGGFAFDEITGIANFTPAAPDAAARLEIGMFESRFVVAVRD